MPTTKTILLVALLCYMKRLAKQVLLSGTATALTDLPGSTPRLYPSTPLCLPSHTALHEAAGQAAAVQLHC